MASKSQATFLFNALGGFTHGHVPHPWFEVVLCSGSLDVVIKDMKVQSVLRVN